MNKKLAIPFVPVAAPDGLISLADSQDDVTVLLETWSSSDAGDTYQLLLDGNPIGPIKALPDPVPEEGSELMLTLAREYLEQDGVYRVAYKATNVLGQASANSDSVPIRIDRTAPGAALLAAMVFPAEPFGDEVTGLVPGYAGMEQGDVIQTLCNKTQGPLHVVQADELTLRPIEITFEREFLQSVGTENVTIEYFVTDRAGNESIISLPVRLFLQL
jgi:hypothetical protein